MIGKRILHKISYRYILTIIIGLSAFFILMGFLSIIFNILSIRSSENHLTNIYYNQSRFIDKIKSVNKIQYKNENVGEFIKSIASSSFKVSVPFLESSLNLFEGDIKQLFLIYKDKTNDAVRLKTYLQTAYKKGYINFDRWIMIKGDIDEIIHEPDEIVRRDRLLYIIDYKKSLKINRSSQKIESEIKNLASFNSVITNLTKRISMMQNKILYQFTYLSGLRIKKLVKESDSALLHIALVILLIIIQFVFLILIIVAVDKFYDRTKNEAIDLALDLSKTDLSGINRSLKRMTKIIDVDAIGLGMVVDNKFINYKYFFIEEKYGSIVPSDKKYNLIIGENAAGVSKTSGKPTIINAYDKFSDAHSGWKRAGLRSFMGVPLFYKTGEYFGQLSALRFSKKSFNDKNLKLLELFGKIIINLFEKSKKDEKIRKFYHKMMLLISDTGN